MTILIILTICALALVIYRAKISHKFRLKPFLYIQATALAIAFLVGGIIFNVIRDEYLGAYSNKIQILHSGFQEDINEDYLKKMTETYYGAYNMTSDRKMLSDIGVYIDYHLKDGTLVKSTGSEGLCITYHTSDEHYDVVNLLDYFTKQDIESILKASKDNLYVINIEYIKGTYKDDKLQIEEISFIIDNPKQPNKITLGKASSDDSIILYDRSVLNPTDSKAFIISNANLFHTKKSVQKEINTLLSYHQDYEYDSILNNPDEIVFHRIMINDEGYYQLVIYGDIADITLKSPLFMRTMSSILLIVEFFMLLVYASYDKYTTKEEKLKESRNTFINAMAHEMKTPASIIINSTEMIQENLQPQKHEHYIQMIQDEAIHLNDLLVSMLNYTRTNESYPLKKEEVNLYQLTNKLLQQYPDTTIHIEVKIPKDFVITSDPTLLEVILDNYISNALEHAKVNVTIEVDQNMYKISNDGTPIPQDKINNIWDPLFKIDESRNDRHKSGIGLSICANIFKLLDYQYGLQQDDQIVTFYFKW